MLDARCDGILDWLRMRCANAATSPTHGSLRCSLLLLHIVTGLRLWKSLRVVGPSGSGYCVLIGAFAFSCFGERLLHAFELHHVWELVGASTFVCSSHWLLIGSDGPGHALCLRLDPFGEELVPPRRGYILRHRIWV